MPVPTASPAIAPVDPTTHTPNRAVRRQGGPAGLDLESLVTKYGNLVSYPQAAEITSASVRTLKRETADGNLPCYAVGRSRTLRLRTADVAALVRRVA